MRFVDLLLVSIFYNINYFDVEFECDVVYNRGGLCLIISDGGLFVVLCENY